jgi:XTP/dITP diphosphohydrolase
VKTIRSLLVATRNYGKHLELQELLAELPLALISLDDFSDIESVPETGSTFVENASLKASGYARQTGALTLADDSGLVVDALEGEPGVHSARYAGEAASDAGRIDKLLAQLTNIALSERTARFVSAIAIAGSDGLILNISLGICEGHIALAPRGMQGFGYDPVFIPEKYNATFAELELGIKNQISHRARALESTRVYLQALTGGSGAR